MGDETILTPAAEAPAAAERPPSGQSTAAPEGEEAKPDAAAMSAAEDTKDPAAEGPKEGSEGEGEKNDGPPEEYADFAMPEGVEVDAATLDAFKPLAKEFGLSQEQAQKLVDLYAGKQAAAAEAQAQAWREAQEQWVEQAKADKEIGGAKFEQNVATAKKALDKFGTPELFEALSLTGAGNHPEFVRFCARVGKAISEDTLVSPQSATGSPKSLEERMYPTMKSKE